KPYTQQDICYLDETAYFYCTAQTPRCGVKAFKNKIGALRALHIVQKFDKLVETADESDKENFASQVNKLHEVSLLQAMEWAKEAWQSVTQDTIANRWRHTGILDEEMYELFESMNYL
ncbi:hypothetical protein DYB35_008631, partial [Aphanomyces astaci]